MPITNRYLKYTPEITLEIFTLVWDKLIKCGLKECAGEQTMFNNLKDFGAIYTISDCPISTYLKDSETLKSLNEITVQEILGYDPFVKEFVLPEKWCIKVESNNKPIEISIWRKTKTDSKWNNPRYLDYDGWHTEEIQENHTEITFDQFKKYVLKESIEQSKQPLKQAVHCKTQEEWDFVINKISLKNSPLRNLSFKKQRSCINTNGIAQAPIEYYQQENYQILSFQEWCDLNRYKMENKVKFEIGKWYKCSFNENLYKCDGNNNINFYVSEIINPTDKQISGSQPGWSVNKTKDSCIEYFNPRNLASIEEIQKYLPKGHPDLIKSDKEYKYGDWVVVTCEILDSRWPSKTNAIGYIFQISDRNDKIKSFNDGNPESAICPINKFSINYEKRFIRHATLEEINNHLISIGQIQEREEVSKIAYEDERENFFNPNIEAPRKTDWTVKVHYEPKLILSIDDEDLPMVNIIKTKTVNLLNNN